MVSWPELIFSRNLSAPGVDVLCRGRVVKMVSFGAGFEPLGRRSGGGGVVGSSDVVNGKRVGFPMERQSILTRPPKKNDFPIASN